MRCPHESVGTGSHTTSAHRAPFVCAAGKSGRISHFDAQYNQYFVYMPDMPTGQEHRSIDAPIPMLVRRALLNPM